VSWDGYEEVIKEEAVTTDNILYLCAGKEERNLSSDLQQTSDCKT
jgi:hypothetical protein